MKILAIVFLVGAAVVLLMMLSKKQSRQTTINPNELKYSQVDITETFDDNLKLTMDQWIDTSPLNKMTPNPEKAGLPPLDATPEDVYRIAVAMSAIRERVAIPNDGVYCPVCHRANINIANLHKPCPKCSRPLLKFGWD